jgi:hypothetical protein
MSGQRIEEGEDKTKAAWYENRYDCSECNAAWADEWSCMCNDRCPECDCETQPTSSIDLSQPLTEDDYQGATRLISAALGEAFVEVTPEDAKAYAEAVMEGGEDRFSPPRWEAVGG